MTNTYVIYGLEDPSTHKIRYIGLSKDAQKRFRQHTDPRKATSWIRAIQEQGIQPILRILESDIPDLAKAREREQAWIYHYEGQDCPLENRVGNENAIREREERESLYKRIHDTYATDLPSSDGHLITRMILAGHDLVGWQAWESRYSGVVSTLNVLNKDYNKELNFSRIETVKMTFSTFGYKWVGESEVGE